MKNIISLKDLEKMVRAGQDVKNLPSDAILTPSARDYLQEIELRGLKPAPAEAAATGGKISAPTKKLNSKSSKSELEEFFNFP